jgi:YD repeat-containing protein
MDTNRSSPQKSFIEDNWEKIASLILGVVFIIILLVVALFIKEPTEFQVFVFRVVLSIAAAGFAATIPGVLHININKTVKAGGALGVLVLVYLFNPPSLVVDSPGRIEVKGSVIDHDDKTHLKGVSIEYVLDGNRVQSKTDSNGIYVLKLNKNIYQGTGVLILNKKYYNEKELNIDLAANPEGIVEPISIIRRVNNNESVQEGSTFIPNVNQKLSVKDDIFSKPGSPKIWFQEAKEYSRTDSDKGTLSDDDLFKLDRSYRSNNSRRDVGLGYGWSHQFFSRILIEKSTLNEIVFINKNGKKIYFNPAIDIGRYLSELKTKNDRINLDSTLEEVFKAEKKSNESYFLSNIEGLVYYGLEMNVAELIFDNENIVINLPDNDRYIFDRKGRLTDIVRADNPSIELRYDPVYPERLIRVTTKNNDKYIHFDYGNDQRISETTLYDGVRYKYAYSGNGELLSVIDNSGGAIKYGYDSEIRLSEVHDSEQQMLSIEYSEVGWRKELRRGEKYKKWSFSDIGDQSIVKTAYNYSAFNDSEDNKEYIFNNESNMLVVKEDGREKEYTLTECGCMPLEVKSDYEHYKYSYDASGRLSKKEDRDQVTHIEYDPIFGKIASIESSHKGDSSIVFSHQFTYDANGNLLTAKNHKNELVKLLYNDDEKIVQIESIGDDEEISELNFEYDGNGKPIKIAMKGVGVINVSYDSEGEIEKLESEAGHKMALEVTMSFQNLLKLVKPAELSIDTSFNSISSGI